MSVQKVFRFFIFSHIFISICAAALGISSFIILNPQNYSIHIPVVVFLFFSTLFIYNFNFLFIKSESYSNPEKQEWLKKNLIVIRLLIVFSAVLVSLSTFFLSAPFLIMLLPLGVISLFYSFPFKASRSISLKKIPLLKVFLICFVWAAATVFVAAAETHHSLVSKTVLMLFGERMFFILALAIPFDIRDYEVDKTHNIVTIPGTIGINNSKALSLILLVLYVSVTAIFDSNFFVVGARVVTAILSALVILKVRITSKEYYYMVLIDGMMLVQFLLVLLFSRMHF